MSNINKAPKAMSAVIVFMLFLFFSGCATMGRNIEMENQKFRTQISTLENQVKEKDLEIESLEIELDKSRTSQSAVPKIKLPLAKDIKEFNISNVQTALKNAGFDPGVIDGKMGKKTKKAIVSFQKSQGLTPDGIIGNATWERLKEFLDKKFK